MERHGRGADLLILQDTIVEQFFSSRDGTRFDENLFSTSVSKSVSLVPVWTLVVSLLTITSVPVLVLREEMRLGGWENIAATPALRHTSTAGSKGRAKSCAPAPLTFLRKASTCLISS